MGLMVGGEKAADPGEFSRELPPEGRYNAVCVDVHLFKDVERKAFNGGMERRDEVVIVWALGTKEGQFLHNTFERDGEQQQGYVVTVRQPYRPSLAERANLKKLLDGWLSMTKKHGADWPKTQNVELEKLVGHPAELKVEHNKDGKYLNLMWCEPLPTDYVRLPLPPESDTGYTRIKNRQKPDPAARPGTHAGPGLERDIPPAEDPFRQDGDGGRGYPAGPVKLPEDPF